MKVLVIPEDFRNDQFILKPLFLALFAQLGRPRAMVTVCQNPLLGGVQEALKIERVEEIVRRYRSSADVFVFCVDRDGEEGRKPQLNRIEEALVGQAVFLAEAAWEEIETWALAGAELPRDWQWKEVRSEVQVKERYFHELVRRRKPSKQLGGGRAVLGREAARNVKGIRQKCPEDFDQLARRLEQILADDRGQ